MTPKDAVSSLCTVTLERMLKQLESLSRYGAERERTDELRRQIVDHVRFLVARLFFIQD